MVSFPDDIKEPIPVYIGDTISKGFDLTIKTSDNISYKTTISVDLPVGNIIEEGTYSIEINDLNNLVFKRV